jgi:hypothetical protein
MSGGKTFGSWIMVFRCRVRNEDIKMVTSRKKGTSANQNGVYAIRTRQHDYHSCSKEVI